MKKHKDRRCFALALLAVMALAACGTGGNTPHKAAARGEQAPVVITPAQVSAFHQWLEAFKQEAAGRGIAPQVLADAFDGIDAPSADILTLDRAQPESTQTFDEYVRKVVSPAKVAEAKKRWHGHDDLTLPLEETLSKISAQYGVPTPVILALWGIESHYGERQGNYFVIDSLATLAFDGRRSAFFREQLMDALVILQNEHKTENELTGSWAGAMGQTQFMPSSFLSYAVDFDGDGKRDIWNSDADALASIANYLHQKGWNNEQGWGIAVTLPNDSTDWDAMRDPKSMAEWKRLGVKTAQGAALADSNETARLVLPDNDPQTAYLVFGNYDVIMDWNRSTYFATSVGLMADAIGQP